MNQTRSQHEINFIVGFEESHAAIFNYIATNGDVYDADENIPGITAALQWINLQSPFDLAAIISDVARELLAARVVPEMVVDLRDHPVVMREIYGCLSVGGMNRHGQQSTEYDKAIEGTFNRVNYCLSHLLIQTMADSEGVPINEFPITASQLMSIWTQFTTNGAPTHETIVLAFMCSIMEGLIEVMTATHLEMERSNLRLSDIKFDDVKVNMRGSRDHSVYHYCIGFSDR